VKTLRLLVVLILAGWLLPSAQAQTSSNTLVRFRLSVGTAFVGDMIVELSDHEKPITVANFLNYVRSGRYKNTILHRCDRGYVLQGGLFGTCNPFLASLFNEGFVVPNDPPIVNETQVGPFVSNTFGTLAMATEEGNPNSALSSWFFNLASTMTRISTPTTEAIAFLAD
jgi:cyclophilin family peptidyl-prolyl cis-trans isomerase